MRWTTKARFLLGASLAESSDRADGLAEPLMGTAARPAGLSTATTASSSYSTESSREKRGFRLPFISAW